MMTLRRHKTNARFKLRISQNRKKQIKAAQKIHMDKKLRDTTSLIMCRNNEQQATSEGDEHVVRIQIRACHLK